MATLAIRLAVANLALATLDFSAAEIAVLSETALADSTAELAAVWLSAAVEDAASFWSLPALAAAELLDCVTESVLESSVLDDAAWLFDETVELEATVATAFELPALSVVAVAAEGAVGLRCCTADCNQAIGRTGGIRLNDMPT